MSSRRIMFVSSARSVWGAETSMIVLAEQLVALGHSCHLVCFTDELRQRWDEGKLGSVYQVRATPGQHRMRDLTALVQATGQLPAADVVIIFSYQLFPAMYVLRRRISFRSASFVADLHDNLGRRRGRALQQLAVQAADSVVAVSRFTASQVRHRSLHVLYRPVIAGKINTSEQQTPVRIGVVGRVDRAKNHALAVRALTYTHQPMSLVFRGEPTDGDLTYVTSLEALAVSLGVEASFEGPVPLSRSLDDLDVLLVTNPYEPMGRTVAEAQLAGISVVVPDEGGAAELVNDGVTGLVYRADDAQSLAASLDRLVGDPLLVNQLRANAGQAARQRHDPVVYAASYLASAIPTLTLEPSR